MGCSSSKHRNLNANGSVKCTCKCHDVEKNKVAPAGGGAEQFVEDPRIPLSGRQKFGLTKSWKAISRNIAQAGMIMFLRSTALVIIVYMWTVHLLVTLFYRDYVLRISVFGLIVWIQQWRVWLPSGLFEKHDFVLQFFLKALQTEFTSITDLTENKKLQGHVNSVMLTIDEAITTLNDADHVIDMLIHIGKTHVRFTGFKPEWFLLIEEPFLMSVKDTLGERYTLSMESNYRNAIRFILETLQKGFDKQLAANNG